METAGGQIPAVYRITVKGRLDPSWWERLGGMQVTPRELLDGAGTVLQGPIRDRAELSGILNTLCDLRMTLLRVEVVEDEA